MSSDTGIVYIPLVDLQRQIGEIRHELDLAIHQVLSQARFIGGAPVAEFETEFARLCSVRNCIGVGNGTDALEILLRCSGLPRGSHVIIPANSFVATSEAVSLAGCRPVFVDVDPDTFNLDVTAVERAVTGETSAIVAVHLYGRMCDMDALSKLATRLGLLLFEDSAQAHLAMWNGTPAGAWGVGAAFSFYPGKNLGALGDAGAITTNDDTLAKRIRMYANHGRVSKYDHEFEGTNSRLDSLQAAVLSVKLQHLESWTSRRRAIAEQYRGLLTGTRVELPDPGPEPSHVYHLFVVRVPHRDRVCSSLAERGIQCGVHYPIPLPLLKAYESAGHTPQDFPVSTRLAQEVLSVPIFPEMESEQVEFVARELLHAVEG